MNNMSRVWRDAGDMSRYQACAHESLCIAEELGNTEDIAVACNTLASTYAGTPEERTGIGLYERALETIGSVEGVDSEVSEIQSRIRWRCSILCSIGIALSGVSSERGVRWGKDVRNMDRAIEYFRQAVDLADLNADTQRSRWSLRHLGNALYDIGRLEEAVTCLIKAESSLDEEWSKVAGDKYKRLVRDTWFPVDVGRTLQLAYLELGRPSDALLAAERSRLRAFLALLSETHSIGAHVPHEWEVFVRVLSRERSVLVYYSQVGDRCVCVWVVNELGELVGWKFIDLQLDSGDGQSALASFVRDARGGIEEKAQEQYLHDQDRGHFCERSRGVRKKLEHCLNVLLAPILHWVGERGHMLIVPDGDLFGIPFAALRDPVKQQFVVENYTVRMVPSLTTLCALKQIQCHNAGVSRQATIVGISTFDDSSLSLAPLPRAEDEAHAVNDACCAGSIRTNFLKGVAAKKHEVMNAMVSATEVIHVATHGLLEERALVLSDGLLGCDDIVRLQLQARVGVLSACNTLRGEVGADGVVGLSRSLMAAGVPCLIVSLWGVPDKATETFMTRFYVLFLSQGVQPHIAMQTVMCEMLREVNANSSWPTYRPFSWAGFVCIGSLPAH